ncbi:thiol reductant ABC exporter subunit CydD [Chachezhania sediminis]|uniref:thiol reductant ABC exporter subunit CydD n=1 Tax=Chachezhania sediminis TaxID=2599291 RepID=UPI00131C8A66|nr:thiol reductant ABC exporter subunit CydD [Chachezhania sediminis]
MPRRPADPALAATPGLKAGAVLSLAASLVWLGQAAIIAWALSALVAGGTVPVLWAVGGFLLLAVLKAALRALSDAVLDRAAEKVIDRIRCDIVAGEAATTAPSALGGPGAVAALAGSKLEALRPYLLRYRPAQMRTMVLPLVILAIALWHGWAVAAVLLVAGPLIPVFMALVGWAAKDASDRQMVEVGALNDLLADRLAALSDLRLIGAAGPVVADFAQASESLRARTMAVLRIAFLSSTVLELFAALGVAMIAVWVGFSLLDLVGWGTWGAELSPFAGIYLLLLAPEFFQPLRDLSAAWHDRAAGEAVLDEVRTWREQERPALTGSGMAATRATTPLTLSIHGLALDRGAGQIVYPDIDITAGDRIALTGPSGSGKTSLLRALAGLEPAAHGDVLIDGHPLDSDTADAWRARLGWMPQAPHFVNRSLGYNIGFGAPVRPETLRDAQLEPVLAALPRGLRTTLGERGAGLSGGEARRVTLARALQAGPDLLLADEPTADLDDATAAQVIQGLLRFADAGGTLVVATHDPRLIACMDREIRIGGAA